MALFKFSIETQLNLNATFNFASPCPASGTKIPLQRIKLLVHSHGLNEVSLLQYIPREWKWTLSTLDYGIEMSRVFGAEQIDWFSKHFQVKREWIEGSRVNTHHDVSRPLHGYKSLNSLGADLESLGWLNQELHMTVLAKSYAQSNDSLGRYFIMFSHPFAFTVEDNTPFVHRLFEGEWNYFHPPCYQDTLTVARWFTDRGPRNYRNIPIRTISERDFENLDKGRLHPAQFFSEQLGTCDSLEDRVLSPRESKVAIPSLDTAVLVERVFSTGLGKYHFGDFLHSK